ncbi:MAG TPA: hydroxymethylglutaryl-CoA lyase, partial [Deferrisomatales bacterium]|nr:hydroxymethylglutaryl-CoA lyase [Deferrisomatales bacterium]
EVSPRDGLQNEVAVLSTEVKLELIRRAVDAGLRRVEVASFVNPQKVPQMAGAEVVCAGLPRREDVTWSALVLNRRGLERALATERLDEISVVAVASDTFGRRNQGRTVAESIALAKELLVETRHAGLRGQVSLAVAFGCPYEGPVPLQRVVEAVLELAEAEPAEIALADTTGVGVPHQVLEAFSSVDAALGGAIPLRGHFHNTRNTGTANAFAAVQAGAVTLDASIGGIGGCPFAAGAAGNIATEDLLFLLGETAPSGVDPAAVADAARWLEGILGKPLPSTLAHAPPYPPAP